MTKCSVQDCGRNAVAKGLCKRHWHKNRRYGSPTGGASYRRNQGVEWIAKNVKHNDPIECLIWPFGRARDGYGVASTCGKQHKASRLMCEAAHGEPPSPDMHAAHSCGKGHLGCVNPHHLSWKTAAQNQQDRVAHGTHCRGKRNKRCLLSEFDVRTIRSRAASGEQIASIGRDYPVTVHAIHAAVKRKTWAWLD